ncbi:MAG: cytochrome c biogenesis protein CcsA, partial [Acidobacteriota bacterium]
EKMAGVSILAGFPFLTIGVFLGFLMAADRLGGQWYFDHKIVWTMITWLVYSGLFTAIISGRLRGKKLAYFLLPAFLLVLISYILANYLSEFHNFLFQAGAGK